jgi:quinolinate synthase
MVNKIEYLEKGFIDLPIDKNLNVINEINNLKKTKNAIILGHYYISPELQEISDFIGDSLALSQQAASTNADIIVFLGVHFMAETAKILSPNKKVLIPDLNAGCSLADSCPTPDFKKFINEHPDHIVISYVNTTAEIKALSDVICTSSNAKEIVESFPLDQKIIFGPDKNLGNYINSITGRNMLLWDGACHVHRQFSLHRLLELKKENPDAKIIAHPECQKEILLLADFIGSTSALLNYTIKNISTKFIVATESGILHQMQKSNKDKIFIPAPPEDSACACNDCSYMKLHNLQKLYNCILYEFPEVFVEESVRIKALSPIQRMLKLSK